MKSAFRAAVVGAALVAGGTAWGQQGSSTVTVPVQDVAAATGVDKQPELVSSISPDYSDEARQLKLSGKVVVGLTVNEKGRPRDVHVIQGAGHGLDEKAVKAVKQYRFKPAMKDGEPVPAQIKIDIAFHIYAGKKPVPELTQELGAQAGQPRPELTPGPEFATRPALINREPELIHSASPEYSEEARVRKINATVIVGLTVDEKGLPQDVHLIQRAGHGLDEEAIKCVEQYRFNPAIKDGTIVAKAITVMVNFKIN